MIKRLRQVVLLLTALIVCLSEPAVFSTRGFATGQTRTVSQSQAWMSAVRPFMYRPYYGSRSVLQRTISYVDHDEPWYADDGRFVRYDGASWKSSVYDCNAGISCYDGHNGYDMNLSFEPVLSVAAGKVIRAGWYNALDHNSSFGLWIAIDHGNGIATAYGHLSSLLVRVGDHVKAQWQIGTSGTTGSSTGPHLHMSAYYMPNWRATDPFGWYGHYSDPNIVPDKYLWMGNPKARSMAPYLGGHSRYSGAIVVDDSSPGWHSTGPWKRASFHTDIKGGMHYTITSGNKASATATWRPSIPTSGYYEVGVYVDDTHATSSWVPYTIYSTNASNQKAVKHTVYLDSSHIGTFRGPFGTTITGCQWVSLGTYYFRKGTTGYVVVNNGTGGRGAELAADGMEFVRSQ
ncbi:MAG TPA: peptidoglycan DD-metalloendopeptidase family protein [Dictyobacter sp.]|nr:peptidoglycan DD-metalloendopeptidase family protein [Dictyobacter sp.]